MSHWRRASTRLTDETLGCVAPTWSPDGKRSPFSVPPRHSSGHGPLRGARRRREGPAPRSPRISSPSATIRCINDMRGAWPTTSPGRPTAADLLPRLVRGRPLYVCATRGGLSPCRDVRQPPHLRLLARCRRSKRASVSDPTSARRCLCRARWQTARRRQRRLTSSTPPSLPRSSCALPESSASPARTAGSCKAGSCAHGPRPGERLPAILEIHGGPAYMYGHSFFLSSSCSRRKVTPSFTATRAAAPATGGSSPRRTPRLGRQRL